MFLLDFFFSIKENSINAVGSAWLGARESNRIVNNDHCSDYFIIQLGREEMIMKKIYQESYTLSGKVQH